MLENPRRIMAVILTHNAPESLARCLRAVADQTHRQKACWWLTTTAVRRRPCPVSIPSPPLLVRSEVNTGPAGGYARALAEFMASDYLHAWVLDDDMLPEPSCLELLWSAARPDPDTAFVFPMSQQTDGSFGVWPSWCGFVISRQIVAAVGLPMEELFWWAEDTEYLQWRIPEAGYPRLDVHQALVHHEASAKATAIRCGSTTTSHATCSMCICT